jgi:pimeloyl-ACP methyl ester carboxylesterase
MRILHLSFRQMAQITKEKQMESQTNPNSHIANINGLKLYYEIHGEAHEKKPTLIMLHGGVGGVNMHGPNLVELAKSRQVIAVEMQGHGRTPDIDRPLRCELLADDIAVLIKELELPKVDLMGYSLGGGVALQTAIRHPEHVNKLCLVSTTFARSGWYPEVLGGFDQMMPESGAFMQKSPLAKLYPDVNWGSLFGKLGELMRQDYDWSSDVMSLQAQTLLLFADADSMRPEHISDFYKLLGGGQRDAGLNNSGRSRHQLAILPGTNHYNILSTLTASTLIVPFLDALLPANHL